MTRYVTVALAAALLAVARPVLAQEDAETVRVEASVVADRPATRPPALMPMYVAFASMQAFDAYSTVAGTRRGAVEQNPAVGAIAAQPAAMWTLKAVGTVTTVYFAEQLWRQHRKTQAIVLMVVANATMGVVAAHNALVLHAQ
jgi:hypothetical protein